MKLIYLILTSLLLTGCLKADITPTPATTTPSSKSTPSATKAETADTYDWFNGTKGTALIQVTCSDCTAIATIGDVTTPFLFNGQGVGQLKYTPVSGLSVYIAVCPGSAKAIKADIFNASNVSLYTYSGVMGNWNNTYFIK